MSAIECLNDVIFPAEVHILWHGSIKTLCIKLKLLIDIIMMMYLLESCRSDMIVQLQISVAFENRMFAFVEAYDLRVVDIIIVVRCGTTNHMFPCIHANITEYYDCDKTFCETDSQMYVVLGDRCDKISVIINVH